MPEIIVALDDLEYRDAISIAIAVKHDVWGFKLNDMLLREGRYGIEAFKHHGKIFADPKLYDIPNTVANSVKYLREAQVDMITVHASGGLDMLIAAKKAAGDVKIVAVTLLTSMKAEDSRYIYGGPRRTKICDLIDMAYSANVDGIVCAADDMPCVDIVKKPKGDFDLFTVIPGIRLRLLTPFEKVEKDDQVHVAQTIPLSDFIVVGRPITRAKEPKEAIKEIKSAIDNLFSCGKPGEVQPSA